MIVPPMVRLWPELIVTVVFVEPVAKVNEAASAATSTVADAPLAIVAAVPEFGTPADQRAASLQRPVPENVVCATANCDALNVNATPMRSDM